MSDGTGSPSRGGNGLISSATSMENIISVLAERGCSDLTSSIDLATCSERPLAGGGFCDVYRGAMSGGTKIAIKSLRVFDIPDTASDIENSRILKRAAKELYHWSKLKHPNVLPLLGLSMFRGHMSMVSEWMENGDLMAYVKRNPDVNRMALCMDVCAGLRYIHACEMVHGDLKAANVMVSCNKTAMIADFGNSQLKDLSLKFTGTSSPGLSIRWTAPELLGDTGDVRVSEKSDVYAYGMTILEILTSKVPYDKFSEQQVLGLVLYKHKIPDRLTGSFSDTLWEILEHCWTWEYLKRPDIASVEKRLQELLRYPVEETGALNDSDPSRFQSNNGDGSLPVTESPMNAAGENEPGRLREMAKRAEDHYRQGRLADAESLHLKVVTVRKQVLGEGHPDTLRSQECLAETYYKQGQLAEAESRFAELLAAQERILGEDHAETLRSIVNLAATRYKQGRLEDAESELDKLVAIQKRALGEEHPDTLRSIANLARTYNKQGRFAEAESLLDKLATTQKQVLGEDHGDTLRSMSNIAETYYEQGRLADAESLFVKVITTQKQVLGEAHTDTLRSMANLAETYNKQGRREEANSLGVRVVAALKEMLGEDHADTLRSMSNLAETYYEQGQLRETESLLVKVVAAQKRVLGEDHPDTLRSTVNLAQTYYEQDQLAEAEPLLAELVAIQEHLFGESHADTLQSMSNLAATRYKQGRIAEAKSLRVKVAAARKLVPAGDSPETSQAARNPAEASKPRDRQPWYKPLRVVSNAIRVTRK